MVNFKYEDDWEHAKALDLDDSLKKFREKFYVDDQIIYMCGNSLGLPPRDFEANVFDIIQKWKKNGVQIWSDDNSKYFKFSNYLSELMADIVGAEKDEITIAESTTTNIHQAISTLYKPTKDKYKILIDDSNFPTDRYAVESQVRLKGLEPVDAVKVVEAKGKYVNEDDIINAMTDDVAMVFIPAVYYRTAQLINLKKISKVAKARNILIGFDFCHAIGAVDIDLKPLDIDFGVWCTYKYLNGGPGCPAAIYLNRRHFKKLPGLAGWFGNKKNTQFLLSQEFDHQEDASGLLLGTPALLSMAPLESALKIIIEAGVVNIREKSLHITGYLMYLIEEKLSVYGFTIGNLREDSKRGGHVCLEHVEGYRISLALKYENVIVDFRDPDVIRITPSALYTSYAEVYETVKILVKIMENKLYEKFGSKRNCVV